MLTRLKKADAVIVGGGLTGLLLGASLAHEGMKVAVLEAGDGDHAPPHHLATVCLAPQYERIIHAHSVDAARLYAGLLQSQLNALLAAHQPYVQRLPLYTYAQDKAQLPALERQRTLYAALGLSAHIAPDAGGCPFPVELSLCAPDQAAVDISRWRAALMGSIRRKGGQIYTHIRVIGFDAQRICTEHGCIIAPICLLTTGVPLGMEDPAMLACSTLAHCTLTGPVPLHSIQQPIQEGGLLLCPTPFGIQATLNAGRCGTRQQQQQLEHFSKTLRRMLPDCHQQSFTYTRHVQSADGLPLIGMLPGTQRLCAAGISSIPGAMHAAAVLTRHILGHTLPEDALFSPGRKLPPKVQRQVRQHNAGVRAANWLHIGAPACAHCGCRLRYTSALARWECPLCASSYTLLGQPLDGPGMSPADISPRQRPTE
ncbi:MAG: FAD-dependent oxidoreductase [Clostridia bacterium]|nr:FAD-dependent oxidoreductase [Clostridia bacterium]